MPCCEYTGLDDGCIKLCDSSKFDLGGRVVCFGLGDDVVVVWLRDWLSISLEDKYSIVDAAKM